MNYEYDYDQIKNELTEEEFEYLKVELKKYKLTIIEALLNEEKKGKPNLYTAVRIKDIPDGEHFRIISEGFNFTREGNKIKVTKFV